MTKREIAKLCCRVLAIYALALGLNASGQVAQLFAPFSGSEWDTTIVRLLWAAQPVLLLGLAWFLWR